MTTTNQRQEKLQLLADWCILRQQLIQRRATVSLWCEYNWSGATPSDIDFLFENVNSMIQIEATN